MRTRRLHHRHSILFLLFTLLVTSFTSAESFHVLVPPHPPNRLRATLVRPSTRRRRNRRRICPSPACQALTSSSSLSLLSRSNGANRGIGDHISFLSMNTEPSETDSLLQGGPAPGQEGEDSNNEQQSTDGVEPTGLSAKKSTGQVILELAIPAAGALLIDPLMTLVDTAFVGRFTPGAGPEPLAGMGSAAALLIFSFYLFNFLCTATTPLIAQKRAAGNRDDVVAVGGQALSLALTLGVVLCTTLYTLRQPLLTLMGTSITGDVANSYALDFISIRALAAPAVFVMEASTGIMRGFLDTKTPIVVLIVANLINLLLDVILVVVGGLGPMGAAIATTSAEWISAGLFLAVLAGRLPSASEQLGSNPSTINGDSVVIVPLLKLPAWTEVKPLIVASSAVFFRAVVLQLSLSAAAAMAARGGIGGGEGVAMMDGTAAASVAAHQIGIQLWLLCSFFCDSLAAASQGLVADALGRNDARGVRDVSTTVFTYSLILGIVLASVLQIGEWTNWIFELFTSDPLTRTALREILPLIVLAQPVNAMVFAADGVLQGASQFPFQAKAMAFSGLTAVGTFVALEYGGNNVNTLVHVWTALIALQLMRGLTSLYKLLEKEGPINLLAIK